MVLLLKDFLKMELKLMLINQIFINSKKKNFIIFLENENNIFIYINYFNYIKYFFFIKL